MNIVIIGASRGIGLELVNTFLGGGHKVAAGIQGRPVPPALESLQGTYRDKLFVFPADVTSENEIRRGANLVRDFLSEADALINVAGVLLPGDKVNPLHKCDISELRETFEVNTFGPVIVVKYFSPLISQGGKVLIVTSDGTGLKNPSDMIPCYTLSRITATKIVGILNLSVKDIDFYAVYPGRLSTGTENILADIEPAELAEGFYRMVTGAILLSREQWYVNYNGETLEA